MSQKVLTPTIVGRYTTDLRVKLTHSASNNTIITDAPVDNKGKGQAFSPTDLVAGALVGCILTVIGIRAEENNFTIGSPEFSVNKIMQSDPRKIKKIEIKIIFNEEFSELQKRIISRAVTTCPVALSLDPSIEQDVQITYNN